MTNYSAKHWAIKAEKSAKEAEEFASGIDLSNYATKSELESSLEGYAQKNSLDTKANVDLGNTELAELKNVNGELMWMGSSVVKSEDLSAYATTNDLNTKVNTDANNFTAEAKETIVGWGMPDFSAGVSKSKNTWYQAETDGWLVASGQGTNQEAPLHLYFSTTQLTDHTKGIDVAGCYLNSSSSLSCRTIVPCPKGIYYYQTANANAAMTFYPCKGEN